MSAAVLPRSLLDGRYRILGRLGEGGMGEVYHARDEELGREVALKVVHRDRCDNPDLESRLRREAKALGRVAHPNVVKIFDVHTTEIGWLLAMTHVRGCSLDAILRKEHFETGRAVALVARLADGLAAAHEAGVIHRDMKPENVLIDENGRPLIVDFGLARFDGTELTALTRTGEFVGTLKAVPPEVFKGRKADARGDVFQLGLILYELLTGRHLYDEVETGRLMAGKAHVDAADRLSAYAREGEGPVEIVLQSLRNEAEERPDAAAFRDALNRWLVNRGLPSVSIPSLARRAMERKARESRRQLPIAESRIAPRRSTRRRIVFLAGLACAVLGAGLVYVLVRRSFSSAPLPSPAPRIGSRHDGARVVWTTRRPRRFSWAIAKGEQILLRGEEEAAACVHELNLTRLAPSTDYVLRLFEGRHRWDHSFRTAELALDRGCWTFAEHGNLFATYDTPLPERTRFIVRSPRGFVAERRSHGPRGEIVVKGLPLEDAHYDWTVEIGDHAVASGRVPAKARVTSLPGRSPDGTAAGGEVPAADGTPLWRGERIYVGTSAGSLIAYALGRTAERKGTEPSSPLRLEFVLSPSEPAGAASRSPRTLRWLLPLEEDRLLVAYSHRGGTPAVMLVDGATRRASWAERVGKEGTDRPPWALDPSADWNRPLVGREKLLLVDVPGDPGRQACRVEGDVVSTVIRSEGARRRVTFVRVDPREARTIRLGEWLPEGEPRPVEEDEADLDLVCAGSRLLTVFRGPVAGLSGIVKITHQDLVSVSLEGGPDAAPKRLLRFESTAWRPRLTADADGRSAWVADRRSMLRVEGSTGRIERFPFRGGRGCDLTCATAIGPVLVDGRRHFVVVAPNREGLASTLPGIDEAWIYLAVEKGKAIVLCDAPLATEVHKQRITQLIAFESWRGNLVFLTGQTLLCADLASGLAAASSRFHTDFAACREDGILALAGPYDQLHLVAAPALAAEANRPIAWTEAP